MIDHDPTFDNTRRQLWIDTVVAICNSGKSGSPKDTMWFADNIVAGFEKRFYKQEPLTQEQISSLLKKAHE